MSATSPRDMASEATSVSLPGRRRGKVSFGVFDVDIETGELRKSGVRLKVQEQPFQVLAALLEKPGELVTRDELRARLWPDGQFLDYDHALTTAVKKLRRALNDSAVHPRFIETLPKRGYRFIAPVQEASEEAAPAAPALAPAVVERAQAVRASAPPAALRSLRVQRLFLIALSLAVLGAWMWTATRPEPEEVRQVRRFSLTLEGDQEPSASQISPDGRYVAFLVAPGPAIYVRDLTDRSERLLEGTEGSGGTMAWSADSEMIAFRSGTQLKRISVRGGPPTTVCELPGGSLAGAAWAPSGDSIVFSAGLPPTLHEVPVSGGEPRPYLKAEVLPAGGANVSPEFIVTPDGRARGLAFAAGGPADQQIIVADLETGERKRLGPGSQPAWDRSGYLLYRSDGGAGGVWSLPMSAETLTPTGSAILIDPEGGAPSVARDGTLVYVDVQGITAGDQLVWRDRSGEIIGRIGRPQARIRAPALSPDERYVAVEGMEENNNDIWVYDVESGVRTRLTYDPAIETGAVWRPDGAALAYRFDREGNAEIYERARDRATEPKPLLATERGEIPNAFTPDGKTLVYSVSDPATRYDLWVVEGSPEDTSPLVETPFNELSGALSPDGAWLAYCSDETGRYEVYVRSFPDGQIQRQVSDGGACQPRWSRNGRELFFVENDALVAVEARYADGVFEPGSRAALFRRPGLRGFPVRRTYDVSGDGRRFVTIDAVEEPTKRVRRTRVVQNWSALLRGAR